MDDLNREVLRAELTRDEGEKLRVYRCTAGKLSIGVGRNLDDVGITKAETEALKITKASCIAKGITKAQSQALLDNDIDRSIKDLDRVLPWWRKLDPVRQRVLVNMCFNMGIGNGGNGLTSFRNTLRYIQEGHYGDAADNMLASRWAKQVGNRATRLAELMRLGPRKL
ncbi:glycoside hydrolase family protein [Sphingomonas sp. BK580]|uniref:glycoside hydrolase family protein n=1 Tax=Sphingomonas sp. BK580 TaxID=2586972 RepID=UPI00161B2131|nr:glycoside hydrolase family protein [Sphingomonas sp. BK580]MBB3693051.1 lysozyme [Sphingomonas sp. BK580]